MQKLQEIESGDRVLNYEDIYLIPNRSILKSRDQVDVGLNWGNFHFNSCVVPANMSSVIDEKIAKYCSYNKIPYFFHRFGNTFEFVQKANIEGWPMISISIGIKKEDYNLLDRIKKGNLKVNMVLIDVAAGFSDFVTDMIIYCRAHDYFTVAGNVWGDRDSMDSLQESEVDAIKIGHSKGAACSSYAQTSFGSPMFSAAIEAGKWATVPVIIDGGIRNNGDIVKAIRGFLDYGNNVPLVMCGSIFAACIDAPGENIYKDSLIKSKRYFGSASHKNKQKTGQSTKHIEGFEVELECNQMIFEQKIEEIKQSLQSAVSYSGGKTLSAIKEAKWVSVK